jgi:hypothetical protein
LHSVSRRHAPGGPSWKRTVAGSDFQAIAIAQPLVWSVGGLSKVSAVWTSVEVLLYQRRARQEGEAADLTAARTGVGAADKLDVFGLVADLPRGAGLASQARDRTAV